MKRNGKDFEKAMKPLRFRMSATLEVRCDGEAGSRQKANETGKVGKLSKSLDCCVACVRVRERDRESKRESASS